MLLLFLTHNCQRLQLSAGNFLKHGATAIGSSRGLQNWVEGRLYSIWLLHVLLHEELCRRVLANRGFPSVLELAGQGAGLGKNS